jgi:hypothetical protein
MLPPRTRLFYGLADARGFVRPQVIHDHDIPRVQRRAEHLRHLDAEHPSIGGPINRHHRLDAVAPQGRQHGDICPLVLRDGPDDPFTPGRLAIPAGHRKVDARGSNTREAHGVECHDLFLIGRACLLDPFGLAFIGVERLFYAATAAR